LAVVLAKAWRRWREGKLGPFLLGRLALLQEMADIKSHRRRMKTLNPHKHEQGRLLPVTRPIC
jgi:hypothetical protein